MADPITNSIAGFPTNYEGVRDLLFLNEGNGAERPCALQGGRRRGRASSRRTSGTASARSSPTSTATGAPISTSQTTRTRTTSTSTSPAARSGFHFVEEAKAYGVNNRNAGMGVAEGDCNGDGRPDLFITNSRGQPHAAYAEQDPARTGETAYVPEIGEVRARRSTARRPPAGATRSSTSQNSGNLDLIIANGAIPVTNLKRDTEPIQVLEDLGGGRFTNASGIVDQQGLPKIIGRGLAAADFDNNGRMGVAINTIGGPLVLLEDKGPVGHWLEVSLQGLPGRGGAHRHPSRTGTPIVQELHAGSSYLSSEDPRAHFGLGTRDAREPADDPLARRPGIAPREHRRRPDHHGRAARALKAGARRPLHVRPAADGRAVCGRSSAGA